MGIAFTWLQVDFGDPSWLSGKGGNGGNAKGAGNGKGGQQKPAASADSSGSSAPQRTPRGQGN